MMSSGGRVGCSALVMLLVSLGAAMEIVIVPGEKTFQDYNDIDTGPFTTPKFDEPQPNAVSALLNKLMNALAGDQIDQSPMQSRQNWRDMQDDPSLPLDMKAIFKRLPSALRPQPVRPQQKWKIKKGKALGAQMVCYFKLCAFRSPH